MDATTKTETYVLAGDLISSNIDEAKRELRDYITQKQINHLTIDIKNTKIIDSQGIGLLIATHNTLQKNQGSLKIINASEQVYKLFKLMRLEKHLSVTEAK